MIFSHYFFWLLTDLGECGFFIPIKNESIFGFMEFLGNLDSWGFLALERERESENGNGVSES
jgi:hypothetical protein